MSWNVLENRWAAGLLMLAALVAALVLALLAPPGAVENLVREHGPVENASAGLHLAGAIAALAMAARYGRHFVLVSLLALAAGAREIGAHKMFTTHSVLSSRFLVYSDVHWSEWLIVLGSGLAFAIALCVALYRRRRLLVEGARGGDPVVWSMVTLALAFPVLKAFDSGPRLMREAGIALAPDATLVVYLAALEEIGECALPLVTLLALAQYVVTRRASDVQAARIPAGVPRAQAPRPSGP